MIGILIIAHDSLGEGLARAVTHVLGSRPPQFEVLSVAATDDPLTAPRGTRARSRTRHRQGRARLFRHLRRVAVQSRRQAAEPGRVEGIAGVNLPMLVRAFTYRNRDLDTMVKKAVSGGCEGVLHMNVDPVYAATRR